MNKTLAILKERGFVQQCTDFERLSMLMDQEPITFYIGVDPTGPSLHIGHMVPFFALRHLRDAGHKGIALLGGGTARIGDPSGKTEMRRLISYKDIDENTKRFINQLDRFVGFDGIHTMTENNKEWLANLNYIEFLREIGRHFSVNRMLSFETYKIRMETGLSFIEFNYQLLQSYDFLQLFRRHGCRLQIGGDDQWGNIVAGIELIRRVEGAECFGLTFPLVTTSDGKKMGKTEKGALFLDPIMTTPFEFFQYFRNVPDEDVEKFMLMFTFLSTEECTQICSQKNDSSLNNAKERLAWEVTALIHGKDAADNALSAAHAAFKGNGDVAQLPTLEIEKSRLEDGMNVLELYVETKLVPSKNEARRLVKQGGASINGVKIENENEYVNTEFLQDGAMMLRAGKKRVLRVIAK